MVSQKMGARLRPGAPKENANIYESLDHSALPESLPAMIVRANSSATTAPRVHDIDGVIENPALVNAVAILVCRELVVCSADDSAATEFGDCLFVQAPA